MIISDLNHLEIISEETNLISGGWLYMPVGTTTPLPFADAIVIGKAEAIGYQTSSFIDFKAASVAGVFSSSSVTARATSIG